jgi:hypothetical protein
MMVWQPVSDDHVAMPDSPAGRLCGVYLAAFNSTDTTAMHAFEESHRATSALRRRSADDRVSGYRDLRAQYGTLTPRRILDSVPHNLVLAMESEFSGLLYMDFELEDRSPHKLLRVRIEGPIDPRRASAYEKPLTHEMRSRVVKRVATELARAYVFEKIGQRMAADIRKRLASAEYGAITNPYAFARRLTMDLRAICMDKHLRVRPRAPMDRSATSRARGRGPQPPGADNHGFVRAEVLAGNVGYIKFNGFAGNPSAEPTAAAAMAFVANTDALIFDLRDNGGGSPNMIVFLSGYLFDEPVHLNSFHNRIDGSVRDTYSAAEVPGQRYGSIKPVYVLTSGYTFSAAEEFTYNLKHLGRATIVGETTGGGAHPVSRYTINKYFSMSVPSARAVNPITKTNWEGVGIAPHVKVAADAALERAHGVALETINKPDNGRTAVGH